MDVDSARLRTCGILLPSNNILCSRDEGLPECLFLLNHAGEHLCRLPNGKYVLWTSADDCGCEEWPDCDCFDYVQISEDEARQLLGEHKP